MFDYLNKAKNLRNFRRKGQTSHAKEKNRNANLKFICEVTMSLHCLFVILVKINSIFGTNGRKVLKMDAKL